MEHKFNFKENSGGVDGDIDICINGVLYFGGKVRGLATIVCFDVRAREVQLY